MNMTLPLRFVPMSPLYNTAAGFTIGTIASFVPLFGTQNIFVHPGGHPVNKVEVYALVTEKIVKENYVKLTLEDGTGSIQCLQQRTRTHDPGCAVHASACKTVRNAVDDEDKQEKRMKSWKGARRNVSSVKFLSKLLKTSDYCLEHVKLGDILVVQGFLRPLKWQDGVMLWCDKFRLISRDPKVLDEWLRWLREAAALHRNLCASSQFVPEEINIAIEKATRVETLTEELVTKVHRFFSGEVVQVGSSYFQFHGYEVLDFEQVSRDLDEALSKFKERTGRCYDLAVKETRDIKYKVVAQVLHTFITSGKLFKRKGFYHTRITGVDQLDALYFVTRNCKRLREIVRSVRELDSMRDDVAASEFHVLVESKHFPAIMNCVLQSDGDSEMSEVA